MIESSFFALLHQLSIHERWTESVKYENESVASHSLQVGMFAHCLAVMENKVNHGSYDPNIACTLGCYHDADESIFGDPNSILKKINPKVTAAIDKIKDESIALLFNTLPKELKGPLGDLLFQKTEYTEYNALIKAADILSALAYTYRQVRAGNQDFVKTKKNLLSELDKYRSEIKSIDSFIRYIYRQFF